MSLEDAELFVESVRAEYADFDGHEVVVYVDYRERKSKGNATGLAEAAAGVLENTAGVRIVSATLHVADAIVCRLVPVSDVAPAELAPVYTRVMNETVVVNGVGAADALGPAVVPLPVFAYERKTTSDLVASVQPGRGAPGSVPKTQRWLDQKARLSAFCQATGCQPALVIEGYMEHAQTGKPLGLMTEKRAHSTLHAANRRDGMPFWNSANVYDTARLLIRDARLIQEERLLPSGWTRLGDIDSLVKRAADGANGLVVRKSDQATPESWWRGSLCLVPGMSAVMANAISEQWPSLAALQIAWAGCVSTRQRDALVADVTFTSTQSRRKGTSAGTEAKQRRVGPTLSKRLLERMYSPVLEPVEVQETSRAKKRSKK